MTEPRIFITDYASYNNGTQFEFGHWKDLRDFDNADELMQYIADHLKEADEKSPIDAYTIREELMITDFEGFPRDLYAESMSESDFEKVYAYIEILDEVGDIDEMTPEELVGLHNRYCSEAERMDDYIHDNDEDFFQTYYGNDIDGAIRATFYGDFRYMDEYVKFNGYGNLESFNKHNISDEIDTDEIIEWMMENQTTV